jgi:hypothetical protein
MNFRTTLILLAILMAIGAAIYWEDFRPGLPSNQETRATQVLNIEAKDVNGLEVTYQGQSIALQKETESTWKMTRPEEAEADFSSVETVVARLAVLNANRALTGTVEAPSAYGLDKPMAEAKIKTTQGKTEIIMVGDKSPDESAYYVKRADSGSIYLVSTLTISDVLNIVTNPPKATPTPTPVPPTPAGAG